MNEFPLLRSFLDRAIERIVRFVRCVVLGPGRMAYRVKVEGLENLPTEGGCLLVCNHVSYADTIPLSMAIPRSLRFTSDEWLFRLPWLGRCLRAFGSIPVSAGNARTAIRRAAECVRSGEMVLLFPEGSGAPNGVIAVEISVQPGGRAQIRGRSQRRALAIRRRTTRILTRRGGARRHEGFAF